MGEESDWARTEPRGITKCFETTFRASASLLFDVFPEEAVSRGFQRRDGGLIYEANSSENSGFGYYPNPIRNPLDRVRVFIFRVFFGFGYG